MSVEVERLKLKFKKGVFREKNLLINGSKKRTNNFVFVVYLYIRKQNYSSFC